MYTNAICINRQICDSDLNNGSFYFIIYYLGDGILKYSWEVTLLLEISESLY